MYNSDWLKCKDLKCIMCIEKAVLLIYDINAIHCIMYMFV